MALLFSEPIQKSYRASRLSCSYFFCWILALCAIILPFFLAFSTHGFWLKRELYEEQPKVLYRKEIFIQAYSESAGTLAYSSMQKVNDLYFDVLSPMIIKSSIIDQNFDDKPDLYDFNITLYTDPATIRNIKIMSIYDYQLRDRVKLDMVSMAFADVDLPYGASSIYLDGHLELKQRVSIKPSNIVRTTYNDTFLDTDSTYQTFLPFILLRYNERNGKL